VAERSARSPEFLEKAVRGFAPEVTRYLHTPNRTRVRDRVIRQLTAQRPSIVIAHSLGSVVAYEALHHAPDAKVELLLTLGSPLALPGAVFEQLDPAPVSGRGTRPPNVARWVNVADRGDVIAIPKGALAQRFDGVEQLPDISIAPLWPHGVLDYLRHPAVLDVLAEHTGEN
jgi:pimeloyl-ACP methyl ester carboxylesterase